MFPVLWVCRIHFCKMGAVAETLKCKTIVSLFVKEWMWGVHDSWQCVWSDVLLVNMCRHGNGKAPQRASTPALLQPSSLCWTKVQFWYCHVNCFTKRKTRKLNKGFFLYWRIWRRMFKPFHQNGAGSKTVWHLFSALKITYVTVRGHYNMIWVCL